jgi:hypothetical protein
LRAERRIPADRTNPELKRYDVTEWSIPVPPMALVAAYGGRAKQIPVPAGLPAPDERVRVAEQLAASIPGGRRGDQRVAARHRPEAARRGPQPRPAHGRALGRRPGRAPQGCPPDLTPRVPRARRGQHRRAGEVDQGGRSRSLAADADHCGIQPAVGASREVPPPASPSVLRAADRPWPRWAGLVTPDTRYQRHRLSLARTPWKGIAGTGITAGSAGTAPGPRPVRGSGRRTPLA